jgi:hypothetical protein
VRLYPGKPQLEQLSKAMFRQPSKRWIHPTCLKEKYSAGGSRCLAWYAESYTGKLALNIAGSYSQNCGSQF